ncbi:hypothetical protein [Bradyrhizobium rifense]|uniref:hypothetical protein n=1 Tax=Bradyrhizobium rifense TaxID=515499 RepID=UPI001652FECF|nr:hypothetical protein [Bradyrhizobium rifense]
MTNALADTAKFALATLALANITRAPSGAAFHPARMRLFIDLFDVIAGRQELATFLVRDRNICDKPLDQGGLPDLLFRRERVTDLSFAFKECVHVASYD